MVEHTTGYSRDYEHAEDNCYWHPDSRRIAVSHAERPDDGEAEIVIELLW